MLSKRRLAVYEALYYSGPCTANELYEHLPKSKSANAGNITTRLGELRDMGCVDELAPRRCGVTGRMCIVWRTNGFLPKPLPHRETKTEKIERYEKYIQVLEAKNRMLERRLGIDQPVQNKLFDGD
jgi:hypothetical protein